MKIITSNKFYKIYSLEILKIKQMSNTVQMYAMTGLQKDYFYLPKENFGASGVKFSENQLKQILLKHLKPALCRKIGIKKEAIYSLF